MKIILYISFILCAVISSAQDIQLHYDFGKPESGPRHDYFVSTVEMFHPDSLGSTFFFIDFVYNSPDKPRGVSLGYYEISREFMMPWFSKNKVLKPLTFHIEYNDGNTIFKVDSSTLGTNLRSAWLGGLGYPIVKGNLTFEVMVLYKYIRGSSAPDGQLTFTWGYNMFHNKLTLDGFLDIWSHDDFQSESKDKKFTLYSEPQIWINFHRSFSVGSEFKVSKNFVPGSKRVEVFPTIAVKWNL
jgi:hypothetical protein